MSMTTFLIIQLIGMFFAYFGVTTMLPMFVFYKKLQHRRMTDRVLLSFLFGNSYIITLVQILQILHISYSITLIIFTVVPALIVWIKLNNIPVVKIYNTVVQHAKWIAEDQLGVKTVIYRIGAKIRKKFKSYFRRFSKKFFCNFFEVALMVLLFLVLLWIYGIGIVERYGYSASDLPVHNYWINALSKNNIFVAGVYPHGYHCMIYFLHEVFGFDTYILLSDFAFVQVICIHFALLFFLKLCCKGRYTPYICTLAYAVGNFFVSGTYSRFCSTLPQEFGMIFILPAIAYGFCFFQERYTEVKENNDKKESIYSLWGFAMSFGLTLSVHFYNTIIAGLFCVAMAIGYLFLFVRKKFFISVVVTCAISVLVAILPMGIAFATGTPLQGSLGWATSVIFGSGNDKEESVSGTTNSNNSGSQEDSPASPENNAVGQEISQADSEDVGENESGNVIVDKAVQSTSQPTVEIPQEVKPSFKEKLTKVFNTIKSKYNITLKSVDQYVWSGEKEWYGSLITYSILLLFVLGGIFIVFRRPCYGAMLWSGAIYIILMLILLASGRLGIPRLMDPARSCIYFAYSLPIFFAFALDGIIYLFMGLGQFKIVGRVMSFGCFVFCMTFILQNGYVRNPVKAGGFEMNEAVTCLTNIIRQEKDFMWTICSANDELRMGEDHGYHYETITFLKKMERYNSKSIITIPTPKVYFFIEKIPIDYAVSYKNSGQSISEEGASRKLSYATSLAPYQGENRWITMSRMYYWAQEFMRMYPNEMKVYMETDRFVCYVVEQNTYSLYNFAIDYGYNMGEQKNE